MVFQESEESHIVPSKNLLLLILLCKHHAYCLSPMTEIFPKENTCIVKSIHFHYVVMLNPSLG